jgi:hypothetical protein
MAVFPPLRIQFELAGLAGSPGLISDRAMWWRVRGASSGFAFADDQYDMIRAPADRRMTTLRARIETCTRELRTRAHGTKLLK